MLIGIFGIILIIGVILTQIGGKIADNIEHQEDLILNKEWEDHCFVSDLIYELKQGLSIIELEQKHDLIFTTDQIRYLLTQAKMELERQLIWMKK